jgi:hypothetical protein
VTAAEALKMAQTAGVYLQLDGDDLVLEATAPPPADIVDLLSVHKLAIVAMLRRGSEDRSAEDWQVFFDERAAIAERQGGLPRPAAEACAFECCVVEWMNCTFVRSPPGRCLACGGSDHSHDVLLPFGIEPIGQAWLHSRCWPAWYAGCKAAAVAAMRAMGIVPVSIAAPESGGHQQSIGTTGVPKRHGTPPPFSTPARVRRGNDIVESVRTFSLTGQATVEKTHDGLRYFSNEFWTSEQRQAHNIHEISYRACFKPQLPQFFIERLTDPGETVYDPFSGRGTTAVQAALMGRRPVANDINPLSQMLVRPRLDPSSFEAIRARLCSVDLELGYPTDDERDLLVFYHPDTLQQICALRSYLLKRSVNSTLDQVDEWIRMVAINRLTGHSKGFFSGYTLPPNQAVSIEAQRKINDDRHQTPPPRDIRGIILTKTRSLLADGVPPAHPASLLLTGPAHRTPKLRSAEVDLVVSSPPFLDVVDYVSDNWLRCWFAGIEAKSVNIDRHRDIRAWEAFIRRVFTELGRIVRVGGIVAFEVGEVRGGQILLERNVVNAVQGLPFKVLGVMLNQQDFTKTSNCWGVSNNAKGTNTNRIVLAERTG